MNYYLIEYHHDSEGYKYEEFMAEDQFEAVELCKAIPFNKPLKSTNKSGFKGVCWHKKSKKWTSRCIVDGKNYHLGFFDNIEDAVKVVTDFRNKYHGEFANHG